MTDQPIKPNIERQVESLPDQKALWSYLERCKNELIDVVEKMAQAVAKAQREGWELPAFLSKSRIAWLMRIANRQVDSKLYEQLNSHTKALRLFAELPIQEQRAIAMEGAVELYEHGGDKRRVELLALETEDLRQLFDRDGAMRSIGQQERYVKQRRSEPRPVRVEADAATITVDKRSHAIVVKWADRSVKIPQRDVLKLLEQLT